MACAKAGRRTVLWPCSTQRSSLQPRQGSKLLQVTSQQWGRLGFAPWSPGSGPGGPSTPHGTSSQTQMEAGRGWGWDWKAHPKRSHPSTPPPLSSQSLDRSSCPSPQRGKASAFKKLLMRKHSLYWFQLLICTGPGVLAWLGQSPGPSQARWAKPVNHDNAPPFACVICFYVGAALVKILPDTNAAISVCVHDEMPPSMGTHGCYSLIPGGWNVAATSSWDSWCHRCEVSKAAGNIQVKLLILQMRALRPGSRKGLASVGRARKWQSQA